MKEVILQIKEICAARIEYNKTLMNFFIKGDPKELIEYSRYVADIQLTDSQAVLWPKRMIPGIAQDIKIYQDFLKLIEKHPCDQTLIDLLHYEINRYLFVERERQAQAHKLTSKFNSSPTLGNIKIKRKHKLSKQNAIDYTEKTYFIECIRSLEPHISRAEVTFFQHFEFATLNDKISGITHTHIVPRSKTNVIPQLLSKASKLILDVTRTFTAMMNEDLNKRDLEQVANEFNQKSTVVINLCKKYQPKIITLDEKQIREDFFAAFEAHQYFIAIKSKISDYLLRKKQLAQKQDELLDSMAATLVSRTISTVKEEIAKKNILLQESVSIKPQELPQQAKGATGMAGGTASATVVAAATTRAADTPTDKNPQTKLDLAAERYAYTEAFRAMQLERTKLYKLELQARQEERKTKREAEKREAHKQAQDEQASGALRPRTIGNSPTTEVEKNGLRLLECLNKTNLNLLEKILGQPKPHNQITYHAIEELFSLKLDETGKLPGTITSSGTSHRKIKILSTTGYFDVWGGFWEPHGAQHRRCLPRLAVEMLSNILERAGITYALLQTFLSQPVQAVSTNSNKM